MKIIPLLLSLISFSAFSQETEKNIWDEIPAAEISVKDTCINKKCSEAIFFQGNIMPTSILALQQTINIAREKNPRIDTIVFESLGGDLKAGILIGQYIRTQGLKTHVEEGKTCASSCVYAFVGGVQRSVAPGAQLGVHSHLPIATASSYGNVPLITLSGEAKDSIYKQFNIDEKSKNQKHYMLFMGDLYRVSQSSLQVYQALDYYLEEMDISPKVAQLVLATPFLDISNQNEPTMQVCYIRQECLGQLGLDNVNSYPKIKYSNQCSSRPEPMHALPRACKL